MATLKTKILRLVFRDARSASTYIHDAVEKQRSRRSRSVQLQEPSVPERMELQALSRGDNDEPTNLVPSIPEITLQDFNDLFPGHIELVYDHAVSKTRDHRRHLPGTTNSAIIRTKGTSFLDLPREIRDEIYCLALRSDKPFRINPHPNGRTPGDMSIREQLPRPYLAVPFFANEILEMHYRENALQFSAMHDDSQALLLQWIRTRGPDLVRRVRRIHVVHRFGLYTPFIQNYYRSYIKTAIEQQPDGTLEISTQEQRMGGVCHCGIAELVQERLLREDAQLDPDCIRLLEMSVGYGPVLGFALQLLEAVRLSEIREGAMKKQRKSEGSQTHDQVLSACIMCGKRKWAMEY